jgi:hypothetical protein
MCWAMDRKGNFQQKYCLLLRWYYAFIWKKEVSREVVLHCNYISFGRSYWAIIILPCVWHLLFFKFPTSEVPQKYNCAIDTASLCGIFQTRLLTYRESSHISDSQHIKLYCFLRYALQPFTSFKAFCVIENGVFRVIFCHDVEFGKEDENQKLKYKQEYLYLWTK